MTSLFPPFSCVALPQRSVITVEGEERKTFLQGLISNDTARIAETQGIYALFLTPQGRFLHDMFITERNETLFIETDSEQLEGFAKKLNMYRLRAKASVATAPSWRVYAAFGADAAARFGLEGKPAGSVAVYENGWALCDPRLAEAGIRLILPDSATPPDLAPFDTYDYFRLSLGLPDSGRDLLVEKAIPLENGMDELNAIDWDKGCYMGQELTARTRYRGLVRKRLLPVRIDGPAPAADAPILLNDQEVGVMRSSQGDLGLALLRLEKVEAAQKENLSLSSETARLTPFVPDWMKLPALDA